MTDIEDRLDQLESLVEQQQETIDRQRERIEALRAERDVAAGDSDASTETDSAADTGDITATTTTRRGVLTAGGMLALLGLGTGTASADPRGQIGTSRSPLRVLYTEELNGGVTGGQQLTDLTGSNLSINGGALEASGGGPSSELVTSGNGDTAFQVVDGTNDVSNANKSIAAPNVVGGHPNNETTFGPAGAFIGGGGSDGLENTASDSYTTIGGGAGNTASGFYATVGGGFDNTARGVSYTTVGGGYNNTASGDEATVGGGKDNKARGENATIGGGDGNEANGEDATVGGGKDNTAGGRGATVPGGANGAATNDNSFVWNDDSGYHSIPNTSEDGLNSATAVNGEPVKGANTFSVSAQGGVRFITSSSAVTYMDDGSTGWTSTSTRSAKTNIDPVDPGAILDGVTEMEVATWEYKDDDGEGAGTRHVGPMAEDFHEVVDVGTSDDHINSINADGVALAAIQGLSQTLDETQADLDAKVTRIGDQQETIDALGAENADLRERVAAIESELGLDATADRQGVADD